MLILYYSPTSPYARKVRVTLSELGLEYQARPASPSNAPKGFDAMNPNMRVPMLVDSAQILFESNVIVDYLLQTYPRSGNVAKTEESEPLFARSLTRPEHHWSDMMILSTIEAMLDSGLNLIQLQRSGVEAQGVAYLEREQQRIMAQLKWLEKRCTPEGFDPGTFSVADMNLTIVLQWAEFREMFPWRDRANLTAVVERYQGRPSLAATHPSLP